MVTREKWNEEVEHPLQSWEWGEFRKVTGLKVVKEGGIQVTIHPIPHTTWNVGYAPKTISPFDHLTIKTLKEIAKENNCIFVKVEPKIAVTQLRCDTVTLRKLGLVAGRPLFTKYNFVLDVTPSEEELLASFKQKTRYNIRLAEKKGVTVELDNSPTAFTKFLELTEETTKRQGFYAHGREYFRKMWEILGHTENNLQLTAHLLVARYNNEIVTTWMLFRFKDTLYYPYGASTREFREVMANNLVMWEAIKLAKKLGCRYLDMWGALGPNPDPKDPWIGFHNFKEGYNPRHVEYVGSWDYVANPLLYKVYRIGEWLRWKILRLRKGS